MSDKPGFMMYFGTWETLAQTDDATCASFLRAAIQYSKYGVVPEYSGVNAVIWSMIKDGLDRDAERYEQTQMGRRYATYCREEKKSGREPLSRDEWEHQQISNDDKPISNDVFDDHQHPTTTSTPNPATNPNPAPIPDPNQIPFPNPAHQQSQQHSQQEGGTGEGETEEQRFDRKKRDAIAMLASC